MAATKKQNKPTATEAPKRKRAWGNQFTQVYTPEAIEQIADEMLEWFKLPENYWLKTFAVDRMIGNQRFAEFAEKNKYFAFVYAICKDMQEAKLVNLGLDKNVNAGMPIFALKNTSGWRDRQDVTTGDEPIGDVTVSIRRKRAKASA